MKWLVPLLALLVSLVALYFSYKANTAETASSSTTTIPPGTTTLTAQNAFISNMTAQQYTQPKINYSGASYTGQFANITAGFTEVLPTSLSLGSNFTQVNTNQTGISVVNSNALTVTKDAVYSISAVGVASGQSNQSYIAIYASYPGAPSRTLLIRSNDGVVFSLATQVTVYLPANTSLQFIYFSGQAAVPTVDLTAHIYTVSPMLT